MPTSKDSAMTADTMQPGDFEARVTEIVNRILARHKPRHQRTDPERESNLSERFVRVEEELKHQRELMIKGFAQAEKRFEQVDKRFEESRQDMLARFEQVDKRFEQIREDMNKRFEEMFRHTDKRFEDMHYALDRQVSSLRWALGIITTLILAVVTAYRFVA